MPPQKSTRQKATRQKATAQKATRQKATAQESTAQESTSQKSTSQKSTQKSSVEGTESPPDVKGNWYNLLEALVGSANGNKNTVRGSHNNTILIGNDNKNELDGSKNLVAERGARNNNKSQGDSNKIGLRGDDISHTPGSINDIIIYLTDCSKSKKGSTNGCQQRGKKEKDISEAWLDQIRRMCEGYLPKGSSWNEILQ
ncbi:hypothetical protein H9Q69_006876 [Fusarium xylarioides]|nr:hypothetical protein H9Q69_006876 [Fusarium xylarioides]